MFKGIHDGSFKKGQRGLKRDGMNLFLGSFYLSINETFLYT
jgi:hypothetical protein